MRNNTKFTWLEEKRLSDFFLGSLPIYSRFAALLGCRFPLRIKDTGINVQEGYLIPIIAL